MYQIRLPAARAMPENHCWVPETLKLPKKARDMVSERILEIRITAETTENDIDMILIGDFHHKGPIIFIGEESNREKVENLAKLYHCEFQIEKSPIWP